jgi:hypothetical protein
LSNRFDEAWYVDPHDDEEDFWPCNCLQHQIERFITANESCPFEPLPEDAITCYVPWMFKADSSWRFWKRDFDEWTDSD